MTTNTASEPTSPESASPQAISLQAWREANLAAIHARLQPLRDLKDGPIYVEPSGIHFQVIIKEGPSLCFMLVEQTDPTSGVVQSEIDIDRPLHLMEPYTQAMLLSLVWRPQPDHVYVAGLGGARVPLLLHHYIPATTIDSTDIDPAVLTIAKAFFGFRPDERVRVHIEDGRKYLEAHDTRYDIVLLDVFLDKGYTPYRMTTVEFFQICHQRLNPGGVVTINLLATDPFLAAKARTLGEVFPHLYVFDDPGENVILFGSHVALDQTTIRERAAKIDAIHAFNFMFREIGERMTPGLGALADAAAAAPILTDDNPPDTYFDSLPSFNSPFSRVAPDLPCPCGSGMPFAACHGAPSNAA